MAYLTYEEYSKLSLAKEKVEEDVFEAYETYAEAVVDSYTFDVIGRKSLMEDDYYSEKVKKAVAYQIDYMASVTEDASEYAQKTEKKVSSQSLSVGETSETISYSYDNSDNGNRTAGGVKVAPLAVALLGKVKALGRSLRNE